MFMIRQRTQQRCMVIRNHILFDTGSKTIQRRPRLQHHSQTSFRELGVTDRRFGGMNIINVSPSFQARKRQLLFSKNVPKYCKFFSSGASPVNDDSSPSSQQQHRKRPENPSIYDMNSALIRAIESPEQIESLVEQLERLRTPLTSADITEFFDPLTRRLSFFFDSNKDLTIKGAELFERILFACLGHLPPDHLEQTYQLPSTTESSTDFAYPSSFMYIRTIIAWGSLKTEAGALRAESIFQLMESEYKREKRFLEQQQQQQNDKTTTTPERRPRSPEPCRRCYKSLIRAWAISNAANGSNRAYEILQRLEQESGISQLFLNNTGQEKDGIQYSNRSSLAFPDRATYNMVIQSCANAYVQQQPLALQRVKSIVRHMDRLYQITQDEDFLLDSYSYMAILRVYNRYNRFGVAPFDSGYIKEIEQVLNRVHNLKKQKQWTKKDSKVLPDAYAYGVLVEALLKAEPRLESFQHAEAIVFGLANDPNGMDLPVDRNSWPLQDTIIRLTKAWEQSGYPEAKAHIEPLLKLATEAPFQRIFMIHTAMQEWIKSGIKDAPLVVESMLIRAVDEEEATGQTFSIALTAWLRSDADNAPYRAEIVFQKLLDLYDMKGARFKPRENHLRYLLTSWIKKCEDGHRYQGSGGVLYPAEHIESMLIWLSRSNWLSNITGQYAMAIRAWCHQVVGDGPDEPNPVQRAAALIRQLHELTGKMPPFPSNWVLETCCRPQPTLERRHEAYHTAIDTFQKCERNARSYVLIIQVLCEQTEELDKAHMEVVEGLFNECCSAGYLTEELVSLIASIVTPHALQKLFGLSFQQASAIVQLRNTETGTLRWTGRLPSALLIKNLPQEWSRIGSRARKNESED